MAWCLWEDSVKAKNNPQSYLGLLLSDLLRDGACVVQSQSDTIPPWMSRAPLEWWDPKERRETSGSRDPWEPQVPAAPVVTSGRR